MSNEAQDQFLATLDGADLTPEQAAQLLELGSGDIGALSSDESGAPNADADQGAGDGQASSSNTNADANLAANAPSEDELNATNAVVLAKDGKHTIPFERLTDARQQVASTKALLDAANAELAIMREHAAQRAANGDAPTLADNQSAIAQAAIEQGVDQSLFGDFSEGDLAKGIAALVDQRAAALVDDRIAKAMAPQRKAQADAAVDAHWDAIDAAHPDHESIYESKEFADWKAALKPYEQAGIASVLKDGSTGDVIDVFSRFKEATGQGGKPSATDPEAIKAAARAAIAETPPKVPASLTDFPGGRAAGLTREEAMADMSATDLLDAMLTMTDEQRERYLNRNI